MERIVTFLTWLVRGAGKDEKLLFKNQREASDFVRRVYNESGGPNDKLREMYRNYNVVRNESSRRSRTSNAA